MAQDDNSDDGLELPQEPIDRVTGPLERFLHVEAASGVVLLVFTVIALVLANTGAADAFLGVWKTRVGFEFGSFSMNHSLQHWINDGLLAVFFFVIGLEVKREIAVGELRDMKRAALPIAAAIGGGFLAGIGFTMALFISGIANLGEPLDEAKVGVLVASAVAGAVGMVLLLVVLPKPGDARPRQ